MLTFIHFGAKRHSVYYRVAIIKSAVDQLSENLIEKENMHGPCWLVPAL